MDTSVKLLTFPETLLLDAAGYAQIKPPSEADMISVHRMNMSYPGVLSKFDDDYDQNAITGWNPALQEQRRIQRNCSPYDSDSKITASASTLAYVQHRWQSIVSEWTITRCGNLCLGKTAALKFLDNPPREYIKTNNGLYPKCPKVGRAVFHVRPSSGRSVPHPHARQSCHSVSYQKSGGKRTAPAALHREDYGHLDG